MTLLGTLLAAAQVSAYEVPDYDPDYWNQDGVRQWNNCYNYAMNKETGTIAQPGLAYEGGDNPPLQPQEPTSNPFDICDYVAWYAVMDGYIQPASVPSDEPALASYLTNEGDDPGECGGGPGYTKVALAVAPVFDDAGGDYHWYRRDSNGKWSHKPGRTAAKNTDACNNEITNPETACRGEYELFCGYYCTASTSSAQNTGTITIR
jgi:hypothetical protein